MKKNLIFILIALSAIFVSCNKDVDTIQNPNTPPPENGAYLSYESRDSYGNIVREKSIIVSNQNIYGDSLVFNSIVANPEGAVGTFTIRNSSGNIVFQDSLVNEIEYKFPFCDIYTMNANLINNGVITEYTNVKFFISSIAPPPPPVTTVTHPVSFRNFNISNGNATVDIYIKKSGLTYAINQSLPWFFVQRVNGQNFINDQVTIDMGDSVKFSLSTPAINNNYFEFNFKNNGNWFPVGNNILNSGTNNNPYPGSHSWFGFKLVAIAGGWEMRTYNNVLVMTSISSSGILGNVGDGPENNYRVRRTHNTLYIRTSAQNPIIAHKTVEGGTIYQPLTHISGMIWTTTIPETGQHQTRLFGWFELINGQYSSVNTSAEMDQSKYRVNYPGQSLILGVAF